MLSAVLLAAHHFLCVRLTQGRCAAPFREKQIGAQDVKCPDYVHCVSNEPNVFSPLWGLAWRAWTVPRGNPWKNTIWGAPQVTAWALVWSCHCPPLRPDTGTEHPRPPVSCPENGLF